MSKRGTPVGMSPSKRSKKQKEVDVTLDGCSLTPDDLVFLSEPGRTIELAESSKEAVSASRKVVDDILESGEVVYGINTGFGNFSNVIIEPEKVRLLQANLIRSHASGVGQALTLEQTRMLLALRINVLAKGYSGIRLEALQQLVAAFNANCIPWVPSKGTVGASGDLAPLAHLALGLIGEGQMWDPTKKTYRASSEVLSSHGLSPVVLEAKEGLAMINGTQMITAIGAEAVVRARTIAKQADIVASLSLDVQFGTTRAMDPRIHQARNHRGQNAVAARMRLVLDREGHSSEIASSHKDCGKVQDSYTLRCLPQVNGISHDTIDFVEGILMQEMNSATDNPMVFSESGEIVSGGNFHGEYPAKVCDYLAIGVHEIANMSERRIERLLNPDLNGGHLPPFLVKEGGLNSGFMISHCVAASLVSENKVLCHPSSVDSIPTSCAKEDHVSMGGFAARKALQVVEHVEQVVAIELMAACQALTCLRPLKTTPALEKVMEVVRSVVKDYDCDRYLTPDIESISALLRKNKIWDAAASVVGEEALENCDYGSAAESGLQTPPETSNATK